VGTKTLTSTTRSIAGAASAVVLASALAACGSSGGSDQTGGGPGSSVSGGVISQAGQGARLSGTYSAAQIQADLPPDAAVYPSSIEDVPDGQAGSGGTVKVESKYDIATMACSTFAQNLTGPGFGENSIYLSELANTAETVAYGYAVYQFPTSARASQFVKATASKFASCGNFSVAGSDDVTVSVSMAVGSPSDAQVAAANTSVALTESIAATSSKTIYAQYVFAADGDIVIVESDASQSSPLPSSPTLASLAEAELTGLAQGEQYAAQDSPASAGSSSDGGRLARVAGTVAGAGAIGRG
jgi:hypothetical protein